jgi:antitoxin ParD1/3/4
LVIIPNIGIFIKNQFVMSENTSEAIPAGLRLLEEEEQKFITLRDTIKEGVNSGIAEDFNPEEHLKMLKSKKK